MENQYQNGLVPDPRTDTQKALDYQHPEGAIILNWVEKTQWKKYTPREQDGSLSCCGQGSAKAVETMINTVMSAHPIYRSRSNFPDGGMYLQNVGDIWKKIGSTTEVLDTSENENEDQINRDITVATPTKMGGYIFPTYNDIDSIAEAIEFHKHCILIFHCAKSEWANPTPIFLNGVMNFGHCICVVDYFLVNGIKTLLCEDSTGHYCSYDGNGERLITEDFLKNRCSGAMYLIQNIATIPFVFTKVLRVGSPYHLDVKQLQLKLGITADGIFGPNTKKAVIAFQTKHQLQPDGVVGPLTNIVLNLP